METLKKQMRAGRLAVGSWINSASPIVAELMAAQGFDFLTVDAEHSAVDVAQTQTLFQAIRSGNPACVPLVRVAGCDYSEMKRFMDAGAAGIICPLVNTADEARTVVDAVKYPPEGRRGVGFCRDNDYGARLAKRVQRANSETLVVVQIEHIEAVRNIDAILSVPGVDVAFIGPYDLSASMGITAQFDHPAYRTAKRHVLAACRRHGVVAGIHVVQPEVAQVLKAIREGYRFIAYSLDITMLSVACERGLADIKSHLSAVKKRNPKYNKPSTKH
jgi:2-dehydro-3-deoxyglucarate aldolase